MPTRSVARARHAMTRGGTLPAWHVADLYPSFGATHGRSRPLRECSRLMGPDVSSLRRIADDPHVASLIILSRTLLCLGYVDQARLRRDEALAEARRISPYNLTYALCDAWPGDWALMGAKEARTTLQSAEQALTSSREQSLPMFLGVGHIMRGWCMGAVGQAAEGIPLLLQGVAIRRAAGTNLLLPFFLTIVAEVYGMAAQPEEGLKWLAEAAEIVETTQDRWAEAEMHRMRGTLLLSMHKHAGAEESYRYSLAIARQQSAKFWELRAASISRGSGAIRASGMRPAISSLRSTAGSPRLRHA